MKRILRKMAFAALAAACAACGTNTETPEGKLAAALDSIFEPMFPADAPGAVVLVEKDGKVVYDKGFGLADLESGAPMTDTTSLCIASVSKQFAAVAVLMLQERGVLGVDDTLSRYFPQYPKEIFGKITVGNLMSHTSGLPDSRPRTPEEWAEYTSWHKSPYQSLEDYKHYALWEESCAYFEKLDSVAFEPGTAYEYQNPTFQLLLPLVEMTAGQDFEAWMNENIFTPLGMMRTAYFAEGREFADMAHGYSRDADGKWHEDDYGEANFFPTKADGALYTTARDFLKWKHGLFDDRLMSAESRAQAHTPKVATDLPYTSYGYGFFIEDKPGFGRKIFHTGDNGGFLLYEGYFPEEKLFYLIFAVQPHWPREETAAGMDEVFKRLGWLK